MAKKKFIPIIFKKISKQAVAISKHYNGYLEVENPALSKWYDQLDSAPLMAKFGSPLFVASENEIKTKIRQFKKIFQFHGYKTVIAYSFKTNYLPGICHVFLKEGCWAEIVSGMEYTLAQKLGVDGDQIIFNGPYKTEAELAEAIHNGSLIQMDHIEEFDLVKRIATKLKRTAKVGVRFNFAYYNYVWDKFGFRYNEKELNELFKAIKQAKYVDLVSIHNHCGTYVMEPDVYATSVNCMYELCKMAKSVGLKPKILNLGGGYPSSTQLKQPFTYGYVGYHADISNYANAISEGLRRIRELVEEDLTLVFEPGRAMVDEAVVLLCTVVTSKFGVGDSRTIITDAGINILPTTQWYQREPKLLSAHGGNYVKQRVCGPLCMQIDVLNDSTYLPEVEPGMHMLIPNVGAYNHTQSMQFIQYRPATILIKENNIPLLIQRKESFDDVFARDCFQ